MCGQDVWSRCVVQDGAEYGSRVASSEKTLQFFVCFICLLGVCFYINNSVCDERNLHSIKSFCSPDLEFYMLLCRPFWLPREFTAIIITTVYISPQANTDQALKELYGNISEQETQMRRLLLRRTLIKPTAEQYLQNTSNTSPSTRVVIVYCVTVAAPK